MVVGTTCSGKTTLARRIAQALDIPRVELDALYWGPDWRACPVAEFREAVRERVVGERWVIDGNYSSKVQDIVAARATDAIWLNYSFPVVFWRALSRTTHRVLSREELFNGNRETLRGAFLAGDGILAWVIRTHRRRRRSYREFFTVGGGADVHLTELRRPREANDLVESIRDAG